MGLYSRISTAIRSASTSVVKLGEYALYRALRAYYGMMEVRDYTTRAGAEPDSKPIRNPVNRLVEFYVDTLWPGPLDEALPLEFDEKIPAQTQEAVKNAILQVWEWSQWGTKKQYATREFALTGDLFIKVVGSEEKERVWFQILPSENVTDLDVDERGIVEYMRIDTPETKRLDDGTTESFTHTEAWTLEGVRIWEHKKGSAEPLHMLGTPVEQYTLEQVGTPGFIPIVHAKFRDVGQDRGMNCFFAAIEKIDEVDAMASRAHRLVFRFKSAIWALVENRVDKEGKPLPKPTVSMDGTTQATEIALGIEKLLAVNGQIQCLVPPVNLNDMTEMVRDQVEEITRDVPELLYYEAISKNTQIATSTLRIMLGPAMSRVEQARGNAEVAMVRADQIALTMAQNMGLPGFDSKTIGTYEKNTFEHAFKPRDVIPLTQDEEAQAELSKLQVAKAKRDLGIPLEIVLEEMGYEQDEIADILTKRTTEQAANASLADTLMDNALRRFNSGGPVNNARQPQAQPTGQAA